MIDRTFCPSGNCQGCACAHEVGARSGPSCQTMDSSDLKPCTNSNYNCMFRKYPCCCNNPACEKRYPYLHFLHCPNQWFEGNLHKISFEFWRHTQLKMYFCNAGHNCPFPPHPDHGTWICKKLDAPLEFPISEMAPWGCESETERLSKLQIANPKFYIMPFFFQQSNVV